MIEAKKGNITPEMKQVAKKENIAIGTIVRGLANGTIVIPKNKNHKIEGCGIGQGLTTKINANIGSSSKIEDLNLEVKKAKICEEFGADALMDLSTGPTLLKFRKTILNSTKIPIGTVPIYEASVKGNNIIDLTEDDIFKVIENQAKEGIDFMTLHCGINKDIIAKLKSSNRIMGIVSRGGTFIASWINHNNKENPLFENFDYLLEIAKQYDVTLSLGDGLRPGALQDATDTLQIQELVTLGTLVKRAQEEGVQTMVEGPGHVPLNQVRANIEIQKTLCHGAPFYVLGPIVTDLAPGYDHISGAIGGAIAASSGADFLCYLTPAEHLSLPSLEDVKEGIIASKIAAQAGDVALGLPLAWKKEKTMAKARNEFNWQKQFELAFDKYKPQQYRNKCKLDDDEMCAMCGEYCAVKIAKKEL